MLRLAAENERRGGVVPSYVGIAWPARAPPAPLVVLPSSIRLLCKDKMCKDTAHSMLAGYLVVAPRDETIP